MTLSYSGQNAQPGALFKVLPTRRISLLLFFRTVPKRDGSAAASTFGLLNPVCTESEAINGCIPPLRLVF